MSKTTLPKVNLFGLLLTESDFDRGLQLDQGDDEVVVEAVGWGSTVWGDLVSSLEFSSQRRVFATTAAAVSVVSLIERGNISIVFNQILLSHFPFLAYSG